VRHGQRYGKFKLDPRYEHKRSDGLTWRRNGGSRFQVRDKEDEMRRSWFSDAWNWVNVTLLLAAGTAWGVLFAKCCL
jgi:hypothetical protein